MASDTIRVGLIGANIHAGWGGSVHARALDALPDYELTAVGTAHRETADEAAAHFGAKFAFDNYRELIECSEVDVVSVVVRVPFHHEMVLAALDAGKHVFCEWPLAANLAEAEEMAERAGNVTHVVGLQGRTEPTFVQMKQLIDDGYVGDVLTCRVSAIMGGVLEREQRRAWQTDPALGAHTLAIPAGHNLDSFRFCVGEFAKLSGHLSTQVREWRVRETGETVVTSSPDNVLVNGVLTNGASVSVQVAAVPYHGSGPSMEIYGTEGSLVLTRAQQVATGNSELRGGRGTDSSLSEIAIGEGEPVPDAIQGSPAANVGRLYQRLAAAIREGHPVEPNFDTAVSLHRLLNAIEVSSRDGTRVTVS